MASPYATLADVLRGDVENLKGAFVAHYTRHHCSGVSGCELRQVLRNALDRAEQMLARAA
jgi:hypothetical protein